jgi:hypothetical protein
MVAASIEKTEDTPFPESSDELGDETLDRPESPAFASSYGLSKCDRP